jgi:hypothetical protein
MWYWFRKFVSYATLVYTYYSWLPYRHILTYSLYYLHIVETTMPWYVVFHSRKPEVYASWRVCSEYVLGFSGPAYQSYSTRMQAEEAYVVFLEHENQDRKLEHVTNKWCWKNWLILVQFVVIVVLWYKIMWLVWLWLLNYGPNFRRCCCLII